MIYQNGTRVRLTRDPRHVGVVTASQPTGALVLWDDTGHTSFEHHPDLDLDLPTAEYGPGMVRMHERMGPETAEATRQQVLRDQEAALKQAASDMAVEKRDRATYKDYPAPSDAKLAKAARDSGAFVFKGRKRL